MSLGDTIMGVLPTPTGTAISDPDCVAVVYSPAALGSSDMFPTVSMARTGYEFILGKIESDAEEAGDKAAEAEMRLINKEMGGKVTVTLLDGREAILTVGNISGTSHDKILQVFCIFFT